MLIKLDNYMPKGNCGPLPPFKLKGGLTAPVSNANSNLGIK